MALSRFRSLMESDQVAVRVEDGELLGPPGTGGQRRIGMHYRESSALLVQGIDALDPNPAACSFRDPSVRACPEMDLDGAGFDDPILALHRVHRIKAQLRKESDALLDVERREYGCRRNERC